MTDGIAQDLRAAWRAFVNETAPARPALHSYCRRLTGNLWDGEDLVQDTLVRAFARWGVTYPQIADVQAYLLRTATNVWIDALRRRDAERRAAGAWAEEEAAPAPGPEMTSEVRQAGEQLLHRLSPQERAALVLKDVFDMSIAEIANLLATTDGAVKAALHRGRDRLAAAGPGLARKRPSQELLDRFIALFNAGDVPGLTALLLDSASAENPGNSFHAGKGPDGVVRFVDAVVNGHKDWPEATQYESMRLQPAEIEGDLVLLGFVTRKGLERLMTAFRIDEEDGRIARLRSYGFCPDTIRAIAEELGVPAFTGLYRAPE